MKKVLKKTIATLTSGLMLFGSTYAVMGSASDTSNEIQPRGTYHVYGDVNNDGEIDINDAIFIGQFIVSYKNKNGNTIIPVESALKYNDKYALPVPQAADVDGDGYITEADKICIQYYEAGNYNKSGRCGQLFHIN